MNFLKELREVARVCPKPEVAAGLRAAADDLQAKIEKAFFEPTHENVRDLNGAWVVAVRALNAAPPLGGDGLQGGAMPVPQERLAA